MDVQWTTNALGAILAVVSVFIVSSFIMVDAVGRHVQ